jgi:hypothetical protein
MSKGISATFGAVSSHPDRETRNLIVWVILGAVAVAAIGLVAAIAVIPGRDASPYEVASLPLLDTAPPPTADALPHSSDADSGEPQTSSVPESGSSNPDLSQEPSQAVPTAPSKEIPRLNAVPARPKRDISEGAPLPPMRPGGLLPPHRPSGVPLSSDTFARAAVHDHWTAVYDISAHAVFLPDGTRLEAHSGLGGLLDDPRYVNEADRGATPPHLYELTLRESLFHGVQALRLNPVGDGDMFGRNGLLAHPYMLGPRGDSNGCVSFKDYDAFLKAFQDGQVKHLAVVARLN